VVEDDKVSEGAHEFLESDSGGWNDSSISNFGPQFTIFMFIAGFDFFSQT
jgi:hypothetical protein